MPVSFLSTLNKCYAREVIILRSAYWSNNFRKIYFYSFFKKRMLQITLRSRKIEGSLLVGQL